MEIVPCLLFEGQAEEAARYYVSLFKDASIGRISHYGDDAPRPKGDVLTVEFELEGRRFLAVNGAPPLSFNEAIYLQVLCDDQAEIDRFWQLLSKDGSIEGMGWLRDRYGVRWQVAPRMMFDVLTAADAEKVNRAMLAIMKMTKFDIAEIQQAYDG
jgi:predicted 3-demethylubiquinone-9 3-methyltransferase (glyoxalase superfamily)